MVLQLPKLLDDGCVLQAGATIHIWGAGDPGRGVLVRSMARTGLRGWGTTAHGVCRTVRSKQADRTI